MRCQHIWKKKDEIKEDCPSQEVVALRTRKKKLTAQRRPSLMVLYPIAASKSASSTLNT